MRILVADDNKANLLIAQTTLERRGHHVELAHNGFDAIDLVRTGTFEAALLDILMPGMDGVRTIRRIHEFAPDLTVFALTSYDSPADINRYLQAGFDGLIAKPLKPGDFERAMDMVVSGSPAILSRQHVEAVNQAELPLLDEDVINQGVGRADIDAARSVLGHYKTSLGELMTSLHMTLPGALALDPEDLREFRNTIHAIKSSSAMIGLKRAPSIAGGLRNAPPSELRSGVRQLLLAIRDSLPLLEARLLSAESPSPSLDVQEGSLAFGQVRPTMQVSGKDQTKAAHHNEYHRAAI